MKKNILITGGAGFLGSVYVKHLAANHNLVVVDSNFTKLKKLKIEIKKIEIIKCDITKLKEIKDLIKKLSKKNIFINILINNAAIDSIPNKKKNSLEINLKSWRHEIDVSLMGTLLMTSLFSQNMIKKGYGRIINIGSDLSLIAPNQDLYKNIYNNFEKSPGYTVTKHGLLGMTKHFASLFGDNGVNVNMLSPGPIYNNHDKRLVNRLKKSIPKKRMGKPTELLSAIDFLIDDKNSFMTGANIIVDGGKTII
jgi:NAD(P)-dependent dehydrogenase (short-subunit alcohol dehydrogenase family)